MIRVSVINQSTVVTDEQVIECMNDIQTQIYRDFLPAWGIFAYLMFFSKTQTPPPGTWEVVILDDADQAGALGYHDITSDGLPLGKIFAKTTIDAGEHWTVTFSHEMLEMLGDPDANLSVLTGSPVSGGKLFAYEVCDPVEDESLGYKINNTLVSDFVYPAYFEQGSQNQQLDYMNKIKASFQILTGGYMSYLTINSSNGWQQVQDQKNPRYLNSRRALRSTSISDRKRSTR